MYIILANLNSNAQYSYHSMYSEDFSKADLLFSLLKNKLPLKEIAKLSEKLFKNNKNKTYKRYLSFSFAFHFKKSS